MPVCECAYRDRPDDVEPWPFAKALQHQIGAIGSFVVPTSDCTLAFLQASDSYCEYVVVFVRRFLGFLPASVCVCRIRVS